MRNLPDPSLTIRFHWDPSGKRWLVRWEMPNARGRGITWHELWLERSDPMDALNARRIIHAVQTEIEAWLPF